MDHKKSAQEILAKLQKDDIFTDPHKAEVLMRVLDSMPEEEVKNIQKTIS